MVKISPTELLSIAKAVAEEQGVSWPRLHLREQEQREREVVLTIKHFELERARVN